MMIPPKKSRHNKLRIEDTEARLSLLRNKLLAKLPEIMLEGDCTFNNENFFGVQLLPLLLSLTMSLNVPFFGFIMTWFIVSFWLM